jgi:hypothetical protein
MDNNIRPIIIDVLEKIIIHIEDKKTVSFNEDYNTIFNIQSINDKEYYNDITAIWWSSVDYFNFQVTYKNDILHFIYNYKNNYNTILSVKDAITLFNKS